MTREPAGADTVASSSDDGHRRGPATALATPAAEFGAYLDRAEPTRRVTGSGTVSTPSGSSSAAAWTASASGRPDPTPEAAATLTAPMRKPG